MKTLLAIATAVLLTACASQPSDSNYRIDGGDHAPRVDATKFVSHYQSLERQERHSQEANHAIIRDEAMTIGTQAGFYWASNEVNYRLQKHADLLDQIDFRPLMIQHARYYIQPAIITEEQGRRMVSDSGRYIRLVDQSYFIEGQPKFRQEVPHWREYLWMDASPPHEPADALLPRTREERAVWQQGIEEGFKIGSQQATFTVQNKIARLTQDYQGFIRYHMLRAHNMVTEPKVRESYSAVIGGGRQLDIEDSTVTIEAMPSLNANRYSWEVIPRLPDITHLFPDVMYLNVRSTRR